MSFLDVLENKHVDSPQKSAVDLSKEGLKMELECRMEELRNINLIHFGAVVLASFCAIFGGCTITKFYSLPSAWHFDLFSHATWPWFIPAIGFFLFLWCCYYWLSVLALYKEKRVAPKKSLYFYFHRQVFFIVSLSILLSCSEAVSYVSILTVGQASSC